MKRNYHVIIIGGGGTGAALAYDLASRGLRVTLFEQGGYFSGTTGRHHGLLHSGARYAPDDPRAARECISENGILRRIAPRAIEPNGGLFVAVTDEDYSYKDRFLEACANCGIPSRVLTPQQALALVPGLNPALRLAVQVPDATIDAYRLPLHFLASARWLGAELFSHIAVKEISCERGSVRGVRVYDFYRQREWRQTADLVVNATGAWAGKTAALCGVEVPVVPGPGIMVALAGRTTHLCLNRLHLAGEGDILVPQRRLSVAGTSLRLAEDPEDLHYPREDVQRMIDSCAVMLPGLKERRILSAWCAARPLIRDATAESPQALSRTFSCYDHLERDGIEGFVSVVGGKGTTLRAMAEVTADLVLKKLGLEVPCSTADKALLPPAAFYDLDRS